MASLTTGAVPLLRAALMLRLLAGCAASEPMACETKLIHSTEICVPGAMSSECVTEYTTANAALASEGLQLCSGSVSSGSAAKCYHRLTQDGQWRLVCVKDPLDDNTRRRRPAAHACWERRGVVHVLLARFC